MTLNDCDEFGPNTAFASEGTVTLSGPPDYGLLRTKPAFTVVGALNRGR